MKQLNMLLKGTQDLSGGLREDKFWLEIALGNLTQRKEEIAFFKKSGFRLTTHSPEWLMNTGETEMRK